jgi:hypothetical protein
MLASGSVASMAGVSVSARGRGADSSAAGVESSSATAALGSSPSQDKSVDFLQSTSLVVNQVRLPSYTYYSGKIFTYKLDRTIVTIGAPSMLVMSTSLFSRAPLLRLELPLALQQQGLRPVPSCFRRPAPPARLLCQLRHKLFHGGGWAAVSFSRLSHRLPIAFVPLVYGVGRQNLL